jgi:hypothetical protein
MAPSLCGCKNVSLVHETIINDKEFVMYTQPKDYSLSPVDLIDDDDDSELDELDSRWSRFCQIARDLDRDELMDVIVDELRTNTELLYQLEDCCTSPYREPERPRAHVGEMAKLGLAVLQVIIGAVDNAVGIRQAVEELHAGVEGD